MQNLTVIGLENISLTDSFWLTKTDIIKNESVPYQWRVINDCVPGVQSSRCVRNFRLASELQQRRRNGEKTPVYPTDKWHYTNANSAESAFKGWVFQDTDLYKWLEAVSFLLMQKKDAELEQLADSAIDLICSCALDNGYLDTLYIINNPEKIFTNLKDYHELYCFAHLAEAAVAYYRATGKKQLLSAACAFADLICANFGAGKKPGYGGHPISEYALVKLYNVTGNELYLCQAALFVERRGTKPYYFDVERGVQTDGGEYIYNQADAPLKSQNAARGHAVRAVYLYTGAAAVAMHTADKQLLAACRKLFFNIAEKQMYITGGIGATAAGEAFTYDYNLPNDSAYCESCASIGLMMFARQMLLAEPDSKYGDVMERCLYNCVLSGIAQDGKSYFYTNPLAVTPRETGLNSALSHVTVQRQGWFECACCPANIARLISSVGEYCFSQNENTLYINMYISAAVKTDKADIEIQSDYIESGRVSVSVRPKMKFTLAFRIPGFCSNFIFSRENPFIKNGYAYFEINENETIDVDFTFDIRLLRCNNNVKANIGTAAVQRGPVVYCLEEADNGSELHLLRFAQQPRLKKCGDFIVARGYRQEKDSGALYSEYAAPKEMPVKLKFIPYYQRANRQCGEMLVWVRR
ncbi:MAG: glycoside hydrolase family 127 protein [Clostridiales bacterium]|nr:glycoside hydrolase family 127 protein [Clostridiales bacterium]